MPDEMDRVQKINEQFLDNAIAEQQRSMPTGESLLECEDCGEPIPEARRKAMPGCRRCIDCQTTLENWRPL